MQNLLKMIWHVHHCALVQYFWCRVVIATSAPTDTGETNATVTDSVVAERFAVSTDAAKCVVVHAGGIFDFFWILSYE